MLAAGTERKGHRCGWCWQVLDGSRMVRPHTSREAAGCILPAILYNPFISCSPVCCDSRLTQLNMLWSGKGVGGQASH